MTPSFEWLLPPVSLKSEEVSVASLGFSAGEEKREVDRLNLASWRMMLSFSRIAVRRLTRGPTFMPMAAGSASTTIGIIVNPASAAAVSRAIATATPPLMAKRRKIPGKKKMNLAKPTLAEKKVKLQAELDVLDVKDEMDRRQAAGVYDFAPLIVKSPVYLPTISKEEQAKQLQDLYRSLMDSAGVGESKEAVADKQSNNAPLTTKERARRELAVDLSLIFSGKIAISEFRYVIQSAALKTGNDEAKHLIRLFLDRYWADQENLDELFELKAVSEDLRQEIKDNLKVLNSAEFNQTMERIENRLFKEVSKKARESYLKQKAFAMHGSRRDIFNANFGLSMLPTPSMLPTLPAYNAWSVERGISKEDWARMEVDDVVAFVLTKDDGQTRHACKRITALAGDVVEYNGQKAIVPKGAVWCEGDNKDESYDSRQAGAVPFENLRSRCILSYRVGRGHFKYLGRRQDDIWWLFRAFLGLES